MNQQTNTNQHALILRVSQSGQALDWINWEEAVLLTIKNQILWTLGEQTTRILGGFNRKLNRQSYVDVYPIMASRGNSGVNRFDMTPPLTNRELFRRDRNTCMYCLQSMSPARLTRDHVIPISRGGLDSWTNVVTACGGCNQKKDNKLLQEINMTLHGVPYAPNYAEWLILKNRNILADQMEFLLSQVPQDRRRLLD